MAHPLEIIKPRSLKYLTRHLQHLIQGRLWLKVLIAMVLGVSAGIILGPSAGLVDPKASSVVGEWLALPGNIFLGLIQMIVVPLIFASVIRGLAASEDMDQLRKMGLRVVIYFVATTTIAITIGLALALLIQPGNFIDSGSVTAAGDAGTAAGEAAEVPGIEQVPEIIAGILPDNPLGSMVQGEMLQVVLFAIILGIAIVTMTPKQSKPLLELLGSLQEVCMTVVRWAMLLAPVAVFGLLAQITMKVGMEALLGMAVYVSTVLLGLLCLVSVYLFLVFFIGRKTPWEFLKAAREVQLLAFSTSSSAAVMPLSMETAEEKLGVRPSITQFLIPLGATINMDGTALYQGVAAVFLAQVYGVDLSFAGLLLIIITTVGASIGAPSTPGVGIIILSMVLNSVGVPSSGIALIIGVDRILDMSRTAVNVTGDLTACMVMDRWVGGKVPAEEERAREMKHERVRQEIGEDVIVEEVPEST